MDIFRILVLILPQPAMWQQDSHIFYTWAHSFYKEALHIFPGDFPGGSDLQCGRPGFCPWVGKIPWRRKWHPTPVFLLGKSHGGRSLAGYSPWGHKESDMTERFHFISLHFKEAKDLFTGVMILTKEIKDDTSSWIDISCSWIGKINFVKMTILPKQHTDSMQFP